MPSIDENKAWARKGAWVDRGEEWSRSWGDSVFLWHAFIVPRILNDVPTRTVLEIGCGHGRITQFLARNCERLLACHLVEECVNVTRERLAAAFHHVEYFVTDGKSLRGVQENSVDFVFSWDSLVHAEEDVLEGYLDDVGRKLRPEGTGFIHHSNLGAYSDSDTGEIKVENQHWRASSMTAEKFRSFCSSAGLVCLSQELIPWNGTEFIDCFSRFAKPRTDKSMKSADTIVLEHHDFLGESANVRRLHDIYSRQLRRQRSTGDE